MKSLADLIKRRRANAWRRAAIRHSEALLELQRAQTDHAKRVAALAKRENEIITEALAKLRGKSA